MNCFYSASTKGFYNTDHPNIPKDAVEIPVDQRTSLLEGERSGQVITADNNGYPTLTAAPAPTGAQLNISIYAQLAAIDSEKISAITEAILNGDKTHLAALEDKAVALRATAAANLATVISANEGGSVAK